MGKISVRLSGFGGQGVVLAGVILGRAASLYSGLNATQSQSYGVESRGGYCRSEVIISDKPIDYPKITEGDADILLDWVTGKHMTCSVCDEEATVLAYLYLEPSGNGLYPLCDSHFDEWWRERDGRGIVYFAHDEAGLQWLAETLVEHFGLRWNEKEGKWIKVRYALCYSCTQPSGSNTPS